MRKKVIFFTLFFVLVLSTVVFATDSTTTTTTGSTIDLDVIHQDLQVVAQGLKYIFIELMFCLILAGSILCYLFGYKILDFFLSK